MRQQIFTIVLVILIFYSLLSQDGMLDSTFSDDGKVTTDFYLTDDYGQSIAIQSDKKIPAVALKKIKKAIINDRPLDVKS